LCTDWNATRGRTKCGKSHRTWLCYYYDSLACERGERHGLPMGSISPTPLGPSRTVSSICIRQYALWRTRCSENDNTCLCFVSVLQLVPVRTSTYCTYEYLLYVRVLIVRTSTYCTYGMATPRRWCAYGRDVSLETKATPTDTQGGTRICHSKLQWCPSKASVGERIPRTPPIGGYHTTIQNPKHKPINYVTN
jgi:hypothetical protein